jgi:hypothetical protein
LNTLQIERVFYFSDMEQWKPIPGYEGLYEISDLGNVKNVRTGRILKPTNNKGYLLAGLSKNSEKKAFRVHQLVAMAFLEHVPCGHKITVDHINEIKTDNRLENLQIICARENITRSINKTKTSSKYIGVFWRSQRKKWATNIEINGKKKHIGLFHSEHEAAEAYQKELEEINRTLTR